MAPDDAEVEIHLGNGVFQLHVRPPDTAVARPHVCGVLEAGEHRTGFTLYANGLVCELRARCGLYPILEEPAQKMGALRQAVRVLLPTVCTRGHALLLCSRQRYSLGSSHPTDWRAQEGAQREDNPAD